MKDWEHLLVDLEAAQDQSAVFREVVSIANEVLSFDFCAYDLRSPFPLSCPRGNFINNYPPAWRARYQQTYLNIDPTVQYARRSRSPVIWSDEVFAECPDLYREAQSFGLREGWAQSSVDANGVWGMLTLVRAGPPISSAELKANEPKMRLLVTVAHLSFGRFLMPKLQFRMEGALSNRELEILKWAADGKTSAEISDIMSISVDTVSFHLKNASRKLNASNKTAAVARAALMGLLV
jgi:DNA-binding CsgD family transcriptional regulator